MDRGIRELQASGLVDYADGSYRLTPLGERVAGGFVELAESTELWVRVEPFLRWVREGEMLRPVVGAFVPVVCP